MGRCKTCAHWTPCEDRSAAENAGGICRSDKLQEANGPRSHPLDGLTYPYLEGGYFWTGPEFGCVHHTEKS